MHCTVPGVKTLSHQKLLDSAIVNMQDKDEWSALMCASSKGHAGLVKLLLDNGASS